MFSSFPNVQCLMKTYEVHIRKEIPLLCSGKKNNQDNTGFLFKIENMHTAFSLKYDKHITKCGTRLYHTVATDTRTRV